MSRFKTCRVSCVVKLNVLLCALRQTLEGFTQFNVKYYPPASWAAGGQWGGGKRDLLTEQQP